MRKQRMFGAPNLRQSKKITQPLVVMVETLRMFGSSFFFQVWTGLKALLQRSNTTLLLKNGIQEDLYYCRK